MSRDGCIMLVESNKLVNYFSDSDYDDEHLEQCSNYNYQKETNHFPSFWYRTNSDQNLCVQEVDASLVLMMSSFWRYSLSKVHEDLWHVCGIHTDIWNVQRENNWYYERTGNWQLLRNYL